jgi:MFS transporter, OFA family, oxalate/formate antiporter
MVDSVLPADSQPLSAASTGAAIRAVLGAAIGLMGSFPAIFFSTLSVFLKPIAEEFEWGRAQTVGVTVPANLGIALGAVVVGRLIDRFGADRVLPVSAVLMTLGIAAMGVVPNHPLLVASLSLTIGLVGVGTTPLGYLTVLPRYFDKRLGLSFGLAMAGLGLGTVLMPMFAQKLIAYQGWRMAYVSLGAVTLGTAAVAWILLFSVRADRKEANQTRIQTLPLPGLEISAALRDGRFWLLLLCVLAVSAAALGFSVHGVSIMTDRGLDGASAARIAGLAAIGVMVGRLFGGALMDMIPAPWVACASFALGGMGLWIFATDTSQSVVLLTTAAFLASFAIGAEGDFIPLAVRRYFGLKAFGAIYGVLFFGYAFGGVLGPVAMGLWFDKVGDYRLALNIAATVCGACGLAVLLLGRYRFGLVKR